MSERDHIRFNDPPLAEWQRKVIFDNALRPYLRKIENESPDWANDMALLMHILTYENRATGWTDVPLKHLAQKGHVNFRRLKAAFQRLVAWGFIEEHPDNHTRRCRLAKRARVVLRAKKEPKAGKEKAQEELRLQMARQVLEAGHTLVFPDGTIMKTSEAKTLVDNNHSNGAVQHQ